MTQITPVGTTPITLCADFAIFPDNAPLSPDFVLSNFEFAQTPGSDPWFVNESGQGRGLQPTPDGGECRPPVPVRGLRVTAGAFAGILHLQAFDNGGALVDSVDVPGDNRFAVYTLSGEGIVRLAFHGGGGEASIASVCADFAICEC